MAYTERLARLAYYVLLALMVGVIGVAIRLAATGAILPSAALDPQTGTTGLKVETDAGTGCQYVVTPWGGLFARIGTDGKPLCKALP